VEKQRRVLEEAILEFKEITYNIFKVEDEYSVTGIQAYVRKILDLGEDIDETKLPAYLDA
jgi:hypothetical protein